MKPVHATALAALCAQPGETVEMAWQFPRPGEFAVVKVVVSP